MFDSSRLLSLCKHCKNKHQFQSCLDRVAQIYLKIVGRHHPWYYLCLLSNHMPQLRANESRPWRHLHSHQSQKAHYIILMSNFNDKLRFGDQTESCSGHIELEPRNSWGKQHCWESQSKGHKRFPWKQTQQALEKDFAKQPNKKLSLICIHKQAHIITYVIIINKFDTVRNHHKVRCSLTNYTKLEKARLTKQTKKSKKTDTIIKDRRALIAACQQA